MMKMIYGKCLRDPKPPSVISVFGFDPGERELDIKTLSGVVPQEDNLDQELNVTQNLYIYSKLYGMPAAGPRKGSRSSWSSWSSVRRERRRSRSCPAA